MKKPHVGMRRGVLVAFIIILLAFATVGIVQSVRTNNPAFLAACSPLLIPIWSGIWSHLSGADPQNQDEGKTDGRG